VVKTTAKCTEGVNYCPGRLFNVQVGNSLGMIS